MYFDSHILSGRKFQRPFFAIKDGRIMLRPRRRTQSLLDLNETMDGSCDPSLPFLSTAGFNTHALAKNFAKKGFCLEPQRKGQFVSSACFDAIVDGASAEVMKFYRALLKRGRHVYAVYSPQRFDPAWAFVARQFEAIFSRKLRGIGVVIVDVRAETTDKNGILQKRYCKLSDGIHANEKFGALVVRRFLEMIGEDIEIKNGLNQAAANNHND